MILDADCLQWATFPRIVLPEAATLVVIAERKVIRAKNAISLAIQLLSHVAIVRKWATLARSAPNHVIIRKSSVRIVARVSFPIYHFCV